MLSGYPVRLQDGGDACCLPFRLMIRGYALCSRGYSRGDLLPIVSKPTIASCRDRLSPLLYAISIDCRALPACDFGRRCRFLLPVIFADGPRWRVPAPRSSAASASRWRTARSPRGGGFVGARCDAFHVTLPPALPIFTAALLMIFSAPSCRGFIFLGICLSSSMAISTISAFVNGRSSRRGYHFTGFRQSRMR